MSSLRSLMFVACALFAQSVSLKAQYMQDTSSTYQDMWFSDTFVYITGSTAGSLYYHQDRVALTLRLPSGGVYSSTPWFSSGYVSNSLSAPWSADDLGADFVGDSEHDIYCTVSGATPVLLFAQLKERPPKPNYTCTAGTTNVCSDTSNGDAPLGTLKRVSCKQWNYCCGGNN